MKFRTIYTTDSAGRKIIFEEYLGREPYERFRRVMLPGTNDVDVTISTKKHGEITLAELREKDPAYLVWIVSKSKQTKTIKYAAMRIIMGLPYEVPADGTEYDKSMFFDFETFKSYAEQMSISLS